MTIKYNKALLKYEDKQRCVEITASSKAKGVVVVVYTFDEWKTTRNKTGTVVSSKDNDFLYRISIPINTVANVKMWFCVKLSLQINNTTKDIWDNNNGWNYELVTEKLPKICLPSPTKAATPAPKTNPSLPPPKSRSPSPPNVITTAIAPPSKTNNNILFNNFKASKFTAPTINNNILVVKIDKPTSTFTSDLTSSYIYNNYNNNNYNNFDAFVTVKLQDNLFNNKIAFTLKTDTLYNSENNFPLIKFSRDRGYSVPLINTRKPVIMNKEIRAA